MNTLPTLDLPEYQIDVLWRRHCQWRKRSHWERTTIYKLVLIHYTCNERLKFLSWLILRKQLTVTAFMSLSCPGNVCLHIPSRISHSWNKKYSLRWTNENQSGINKKTIELSIMTRQFYFYKLTLALASQAPDTNVR